MVSLAITHSVSAALLPPPVPVPALQAQTGGYVEEIVAQSATFPSSMNCGPQSSICLSQGTYGGANYYALATPSPNLAVPSYVNPEVQAIAIGQNDTTSAEIISTSSAYLGYYFEIEVPPGTYPPVIPVTVDVTATGTSSYNGPFSSNGGDGKLFIYTGAGSEIFGACEETPSETTTGSSPCFLDTQANGTTVIPTSFTLTNLQVPIYANQPYEIYLEADAEIAGGAYSASGTVDPYLAIDPDTLADYPDAELFLSTGVVQQAPSISPVSTPEPKTFSMLLMSILAAIGIGRYKGNGSQT